MSAIDEQSLVIIGVSAAAGAKAADVIAQLALAFFRPTLTAAGELIASPLAQINQRRAARAAATIEQAGRLLDEAGIRGHQVPDKLLWPIVDYSSRDDDAFLRDQWAALLANASVDQVTLLPAFIEILANLSAFEVKLLKDAFPAGKRSAGSAFYLQDGENHFVDLSQAHPVHTANLARLNLLDEPSPEFPIESLRRVVASLESRIPKPSRTSTTLTRPHDQKAHTLSDHDFSLHKNWGIRYRLTAFGSAFLVACDPPAIEEVEAPPPSTFPMKEAP